LSGNPTMQTRKEDCVINVFKDSFVIREYNEGLVTSFGAGDITYQIRGEV